MRAKRQEHERSSPSEKPGRARAVAAADVQQASPSPALVLQARLQNALLSPAIDTRLPSGQRAAIVFLLAVTSWSLIGGLVAIVR